LIESGLDLMVTVSREGTITDVNTAAVELTGTSRERLIGTPFVNFFDEPARARAGIERCFLEGQVRNYELRICHPRCESIPVSFNASVYRGRDGQVQGAFGIARDIRERLKMVRESEEARSYARSLLESCPDLMVAIDRDGCITEVNEAAVGLTGKSRDELVLSRFDAHFVDPARAREGVRLAFAAGVVRQYDLELRGKSGRLVAVSFIASQHMNAQHQVVGVIAIARTVE
jgi:PAS domain S-box-containing protein